MANAQNGIWRQEGAKALVEFLTNATGEDHDAAVYDTKLEFDSQNPVAIRYVAAVAMSKAYAALHENAAHISPPVEQMPADGSVVPLGSVPQNKRMLTAYDERMKRETDSRQDWRSPLYIPNADAYCKAVLNALSNTDIPYEDMTPEECEAHQQRIAEEEHRKAKARFRYDTLPKLMSAIVVFACAIIVLWKLSH